MMAGDGGEAKASELTSMLEGAALLWLSFNNVIILAGEAGKPKDSDARTHVFLSRMSGRRCLNFASSPQINIFASVASH